LGPFARGSSNPARIIRLDGDYGVFDPPAAPLAREKAEAGMAEMSEKFREKGGEIYLPADG